MSSGESFYITTPIFYVNDVPHIGHAYTEVAADFLVRWNRLRGIDSWLLTGTDEHGQKILRSATANGYEPQAWVDHLVETAWKPLLETIQISNDDFIRTTEARHEKVVTEFFLKLRENEQIYTGEFEGYYCVGCEEYKGERDLVDGTGAYEGEKVCSIHSKPVEVLEERNYFFKLSEYQQPLLDFYAANPNFIQPESARNEIVSFVKSGLEDLSISRSTFDWGIKVPWDDSHVIYVWIDALINYISALGYGSDDDKFDRFWPGVHLVGKDILRFHAVIWPAMLMAAGITPPHKVFGHGWLLVGGEKMSKSKLTGIEPQQITSVFGSDAFRYYFLSAISFGQDGSFSWEDLHNRYTAELANGLGNLVSRVTALITKNFDAAYPAAGGLTEADQAVVAAAQAAVAAADQAVTDFAPHLAIDAMRDLVEELNGYLTEQEPWHLIKQEGSRERVGTILATCAETLRVLAVLHQPAMPAAAEKIWQVLNLEPVLGKLADQRVGTVAGWNQIPAGAAIGQATVLFPRIEEEKTEQ